MVLAQPTELTGRAEVLAAAGDHPYVRLHTGQEPVRGFTADGGAVAWTAPGRRGPRLSAWGDPAAAVRLLGLLRARGTLAGVSRADLPRVDHALLAAGAALGAPEDWLVRWTAAPPPTGPEPDRVRRLDDAADFPAIEALLRRVFPDTGTRPGDPRVRGWYGIRDQGRLVACAADRSRGGVGSIGAVAVDPAFQGRGLGGTLTGTLARALVEEFGMATLGVQVGNDRAARLYLRLGFTGEPPVPPVPWPPEPPHSRRSRRRWRK